MMAVKSVAGYLKAGLVADLWVDLRVSESAHLRVNTDKRYTLEGVFGQPESMVISRFLGR
jgi:hypothetical protein